MDIPLTIDELHKGFKNKTHSISGVIEQYLSRIEAFDKNLNAFVTVTHDYARERAKKLETILADNPNAFEEFPLLGVTMAVKDMYLTRGVRTTAGSKVLESFIPEYSSTAFERLEAAGAILVGKANCDAWAHGSSGENSDFGATHNPWNLDYVPGGSSSGSAVAVSSGMSMFSMGTDTGGSIRLPASFCNVVGLKPTYGAVSRYGVIAMASSLDSMGHFTRSVKDSEKIFKVTRGTDGHDGTLRNADYAHKNVKKIGLPREYFSDGLSEEVREKTMAAVDVYKKAGYEIVDVSIPSTKYAISIYYIVMPAEVSSNLGRYDGIRYGNKRDSFGAEAKRRIMLGTHVLSSGYYDAYYNKAMKARTLLRNDFDKVFTEVDALIAPASPTLPFKLGEKMDNPLEMYLADIFTVSANLVGIPGISIPAGFSDSGLPIGFQLFAPRFMESSLFELGNSYQSMTDFHLKTPSL